MSRLGRVCGGPGLSWRGSMSTVRGEAGSASPVCRRSRVVSIPVHALGEPGARSLQSGSALPPQSCIDSLSLRRYGSCSSSRASPTLRERERGTVTGGRSVEHELTSAELVRPGSLACEAPPPYKPRIARFAGTLGCWSIPTLEYTLILRPRSLVFGSIITVVVDP